MRDRRDVPVAKVVYDFKCFKLYCLLFCCMIRSENKIQGPSACGVKMQDLPQMILYFSDVAYLIKTITTILRLLGPLGVWDSGAMTCLALVIIQPCYTGIQNHFQTDPSVQMVLSWNIIYPKKCCISQSISHLTVSKLGNGAFPCSTWTHHGPGFSFYVNDTGRFMNGVLKWEGPSSDFSRQGKKWVLCCSVWFDAMHLHDCF